MFGAAFGVTSVLGPLLGGVFVDNLCWRWVFYINLPIGVVALIVIAAVLHSRLSKTRHRIDYPGTALIGAAAVCLVLLTSLGGTTWRLGLLPGLPPRRARRRLLGWFRRGRAPCRRARPTAGLFRNRVFTSAA